MSTAWVTQRAENTSRSFWNTLAGDWFESRAALPKGRSWVLGGEGIPAVGLTTRRSHEDGAADRQVEWGR